MSQNSKNTKKGIILFCIFIVPLLFFLFLASGRVNFNKLPVLTEQVSDLNGELPFRTKITIVSVLGNDQSFGTYQNVLNLYQVVYKSMEKYSDFQIVTLIPNSNTEIIEGLYKELTKVGGVDLSQWKFIVLDETELHSVVSSFGFSSIQYNLKTGMKDVFIVDDQLRLRGRTDDEDSQTGVMASYTMASVAVLKNKLKDDLDVVFYESKFSIEEPKLN